jgi:hypothetical protein
MLKYVIIEGGSCIYVYMYICMWPASLTGLSMVMKKKKVRSGTLGIVGDRVKSIRQELETSKYLTGQHVRFF